MRQSICVEHLVNRMGSIEYFITPHSVDPIRLTTHISTHAQVLGHNLASGGCQPTELPAFDSEGLHPPLAGFAASARRQSPDTAILQSIVMPKTYARVLSIPSASSSPSAYTHLRCMDTG